LAAALDLLASPSLGEGFPNVVAEAMACGVPCVVSDAGDSAALVGATGRIVPPGDPDALAAACQELITAGAARRQKMGAAARRRVAERYSLAATVAAYQELYQAIVPGHDRPNTA
jgi:glycosyltransferase involved in cell wall biosynthesis